MRLNVGIQALAPSRWIDIEPGKRLRVRRRGSRAHQKWLRKRRHDHPQMAQLVQTFLSTFASTDEPESAPAPEEEPGERGVVGRPDDGLAGGDQEGILQSPRGRRAALEVLAQGNLDWMAFLDMRGELEREEALELLEDWEGLVLDQDDNPLPFSKEIAEQLLEEEGLYKTYVAGQERLVPFGDYLVERILEAADDQDKFLAEFLESTAKNSAAPSPSNGGGEASTTSIDASSIAS